MGKTDEAMDATKKRIADDAIRTKDRVVDAISDIDSIEGLIGADMDEAIMACAELCSLKMEAEEVVSAIEAQ